MPAKRKNDESNSQSAKKPKEGGRGPNWTLEEDYCLLTATKKVGRTKWNMVVAELKQRHQCEQRMKAGTTLEQQIEAINNRFKNLIKKSSKAYSTRYERPNYVVPASATHDMIGQDFLKFSDHVCYGKIY